MAATKETIRSTGSNSASSKSGTVKVNKKTSATSAKSSPSKNSNGRSAKSAGSGAGKSGAPKSGKTGVARKKSGGGDGVVSSIVKAVAGMFKAGKPDAVELLKNDHRVVDGLFAKVKANEDGNNRTVFRKIKSELDAHAHIEETVFYPYLLENGKKDLKKIVREGIEEHSQVKMFLAEMDGLTGTSETFKAKMKVLIEDVEHHVQEEEDEMFSIVRDQFSEDVLKKLATKMSSAKERFKKRAANKTVKTPSRQQKSPAAA